MNTIEERFSGLATEHAPGQEGRRHELGLASLLRGDSLAGTPVDFSHGDVNESAFAPTPGSLDVFIRGVERGGAQAYTEYRGGAELRDSVAARLSDFTGHPVSGADELIITPGTQGALFLAIAATVAAGDKVAIVCPDYFANRKLVAFFGGQIVPVPLNYLDCTADAGLDLNQLEAAFKGGAKTFLFSNPNNPAGVVYSRREIERIAALANRYGVTVIVDQLYSRLLYTGTTYTHLRASGIEADRVVTIMGPSKTESLSGYRLGVAFGAKPLVDRMESLQAIVSLRAPGYCQAVLHGWFEEPEGWMLERIARHQAIRDDLVRSFRAIGGVAVRSPEAGSYLFPRLPALSVSLHDFVRILRHQAGVTVTPGTEFSPHADDSIRLNFSQNHAAAQRAVERIAQLVERYRA
ncbi:MULTISPECIES: pyridoxal phosphate-dependent aminotransferase [unclassified Burkholderia]|uniref:pyridoxal phosphate-dependent aminotransferase n=1 Tax=unclassified Burkholderia TaxID=2613784 RepID=UPI0014236198|nr:MULTISPECIES: pyridoxal phosphate-dependent aminotransferase [unclassified Burkholderia]NIE83383.1 aminotransferase class I/II-fold pyridoxal phosphate-dependent enzyme [Burkholderia sp. Tr-860]NIF61719.1 aminotransferase class I/II-fold pyridoxal phosphate-dependent enzyme [Burkholderia sp. Cy-647]NIF70140.1 aminotransferase class I/II-fold pyridoxal phosphate-dependent enzyme [Burkholderia sp. Ap-962]NIF96892.1 aminotransferase class I/II-fold pyridoxal phosphate-dependent enzyme [Burkhold